MREFLRAMILAAGEGTRMRPLTFKKPKVLLPVAGIPLIIYTLAWLKSHDVRDVAINVYHLGEQISDLLGNGSRFGMRIHYSPEEKLRGTAGSVKSMEKFFGTTFVVVYGDALTDFNLPAMIDFHKEKRAIATLSLLRMPNPWEDGIVNVNRDGKLLSFVEKPRRKLQSGDFGSGGVYVLDREILAHIPTKGSCDFGYDIFPRLIGLGLPIYGYLLRPKDYLIDVGTPDKYCKANEDVKRGRVRLFLEAQ